MPREAGRFYYDDALGQSSRRQAAASLFGSRSRRRTPEPALTSGG
jgi:hypothetical protein